jgi:nucleotide-binding universal stress UspA family protein
MTILIGLAPGQKDDAAVHLGGMLARSTGEDVIVLAVVPEPWPPDPYQADKEYLAHLEGRANQALTRARTYLQAGSPGVEALLLRAESVAAGLLQVVEERQVSSVALGSSSTGLLGRVMLGGVAERILHATELPVIIAPRAFHEGRATRVARVSVAFGRADHDGGLVARAAAAALGMSAPLRVVCFAVRPMAEYVGAMEPANEQLVVGEWMKRLDDDIAAALGAAAQQSEHVGGQTATVARVETVLGQGGSWAEALHDVAWRDGDLLVVGTSTGPLSRLFLGSHAAKIVRNSPVPVMLLPRAHEPPA